MKVLTVNCLAFLFLLGTCGKAQVSEKTHDLIIDSTKMTVVSRIVPPAGFRWNTEEEGSFADFLRRLPLYPAGFPVRDFSNKPLQNQNNHFAVLNIDVGMRDLQQCADAWIRLYAEYLWATENFDGLSFQLTSGQIFSWADYSKGIRTKEMGSRVKFYETGKADRSYRNFKNYLNVIFNYAGTISLFNESNPVLCNEDIKAGDFIIKPGSPGHLVIIMGISRDKTGKKRYLLGESFMPAQDIHLLKNHQDPKISPWYELSVHAPVTKTARYIFNPTVIKRFHALK